MIALCVGGWAVVLNFPLCFSNFCCGEFAPGKAAEKMRRDHERTKTQLQTVKPSTGEGCPANRKGSSKSGQVLKFVPEG
jgi:hypothetical protein